MSTSDLQESGESSAKPRLSLEVDIESPQSCIRHVVVKIPQSDVELYMKDAYDELVPEAQIPGFRAGRAPRKLVEKQFRDRVSDQVKSSLLMDSLSQVTESAKFSAIGEPDFDYESIDLPSEGDFRYEFTVEVRPEFTTPKWNGLDLQRPIETVTEEHVTDALNNILEGYAPQEPTDQPAELGDALLITAEFTEDGKKLSGMEEERVTLRPALSFSDARCESFGELLAGAKEGETRKGQVTISEGVENESLRGKEVDVEFSVVEVYHTITPQLTEKFLYELGDFESEDELRGFVRASLERQSQYHQNQELRKQIVKLLTVDASFDLPPDLVKKQTHREIERKVLELRRNGFDEAAILRYVNAVKSNAQVETEAALREHFVLEKIAEEQKVEASADDFNGEIKLIAEQRDESERRVRARLEKTGQMDVLRNQIIERKVIELITEEASIKDVETSHDATKQADSEFAIDFSVLNTKDTGTIPEAKYADEAAAQSGADGAT